MTTKAKAGIHKLEAYTSLVILSKEALLVLEWKTSMQRELDAILANMRVVV